MIAVSSSASFGSAGVTMTSEVFSTFIWRRSLSGSASASYLVASLASLTVASMDSWLMRALSAAVSSVMKFCATQPARFARMPNLRCVWFACSRKAPASAGVTALPGAEAALQATLANSRTPEQQRVMRIIMRIFYEDSRGPAAGAPKLQGQTTPHITGRAAGCPVRACSIVVYRPMSESPVDTHLSKPALLLLIIFPLLKLALHLAVGSGYGYHGDELYYLACADRLDWGYVDHPPFS